MSIDSVLNKEIVILGFKKGSSKFKDGDYITIQFELDGDHKILFTGSEVIRDQIEKYQSHIPFVATIQKIDRYYTLT